MNYLIKQIGIGHSIAVIVVAILTLLAMGAKADMPKRISYAIDYELGIAQQCDGTDSSYEVYGCKYDYSDLLNQ
jgi:hypothetical protein|nr:MAG TPA: hypothetical protein [Caudoviricetes sp.]DAY39881.1 MAG TPA: hypothetical protein [Caudoviricetes sp.]